MTDACLIAGNASADVVQLSGLRLARHLWVGDQGAGHPAHIGSAPRQCLLCDLWLVDAPRDKNGLADHASDRGRQRRGIPCVKPHGGHDMGGPGEPRRGARSHVQII